MQYLRPERDAPAATQCAVIAPVQAADAVVGDHRHHWDAAAVWGVPAHVTILYPFVEPKAIDDRVLASLTQAVGSVEAFDCHFRQTGWFDDDVLWLAPDPPEPLERLTSAVSKAFPAHPPYGGGHDEVVPHLTVAERRLCDALTMRAVEQEVLRRLPLSTRIDRVLLIAGAQAPNSWRVLDDFPLGGAADIVS